MATCNDCFHYEACKKIFQIAFKDFADYTFVKACELYKPTADVVEVTHGEWRELNEKYPRYVCTVCNHLFNNKNYNYCPCCGAKMDGKE